MNKLGLAQSYVDTDLHIGFSLNEGAWTLRLKDRRTLLHKLSPFLGTDCTENVLSAIFGTDGCVLNIYSANPEAGDGYFATHVFIPSGLIISGDELEDIIEALKIGDEAKIGLYFNKEYPDEGPRFHTRFSEVCAVRYYGGGRTLKDILSHLFTMKSSDFSEVFFLDRNAGISPDGTIKDITGSEEETRILTDLEPAKGTLTPDEIYVDGILWEGTPIYTLTKTTVTLKKKGYGDVIIKDTPVDEKGFAKFTPDWKLKLDFNTFRIANAEGENLDGYSITVNSEPVTPDRSVSMPSAKAKKALVRVERPGCQTFEKEMDLTTDVRFTITLSKDVKTRQFLIKTLHDGKQASLDLILPDMLTESPLEGYRLKDSDGEKKATLVYDPFAFLQDRKWQLIIGGVAAGILLLGLVIGILIGSAGKKEKKVRAVSEPVTTEAVTPAVSAESPSVKAYLDTVKVIDRQYMESLGIAALYDALNTYNPVAADSILTQYDIKRGYVKELTDNMRFYTGKLRELGRPSGTVWSEDKTPINCERFTTNLANKIATLQ